MMKYNYKGFVCMAALTLSMQAHAQNTGANGSESASDEVAAFDNIIVTARRRNERAVDVPATLSAFGADELKASGVVDISDIAPRTPGFYAGGFGSSRPQLYIRGIGTRQFDPGSESSIGVFVDESYLGRTGGVLGSLKDIERIEVLKGPQGTLYGRNTIGGAINVITKGPTDEYEAEGEFSYGNYNFTEFFGAVSGPIIEDELGARLAVWKSDRDGYQENLSGTGDAQGLDNFGARLRVDWTPSEALSIGLIGEITKDKGASFQGQSVGNTSNPIGILLGSGGTPTVSSDPFKQYYNTGAAYDREISAFTGKLEYETDAGTFVSISSFRHLEYEDDRDFDNTDLFVIRQITEEKSDQFTQEFRFVSASDGPLSADGKLDWVVGAYYYNDDSAHSDLFLYGPDSVVFTVGGQETHDTTYGEYSTESYAAFAQGTWRFNDQWEMTLGGRYSEDTKQASLGGITDDSLFLVSAAFEVMNPEKKFSSFDPMVSLSFKPKPDMNIYASYSQGYKAGGYQYTPLKATQAASVFEAESIDNYELGFKSELGGGMTTLNGAIYYSEYDDIQVSRIVELSDGSTPTLISNAGKSTIKGGEIDLTLRPSDGLELGLAYAFTDAMYDEYIASDTKDYSNTRMVRAPKHSFNVSAQYEFPVSQSMDLMLRADYAYLSDFYHEPGEANPVYSTVSAFTKEEGYGVANLRATLSKDNWDISLWAKNATDELYRRTVHALPGQVINYYAIPRTYGVTLGVNF